MLGSCLLRVITTVHATLEQIQEVSKILFLSIGIEGGIDLIAFLLLAPIPISSSAASDNLLFQPSL